VAPLVIPVDLGPHARAAVTGRDRSRPAPPVGAAGNLSHRRPHRPDDLARARNAVGEATGMPPARWHLLRQVHGASVATIGAGTPVGAELRDVDAAVTTEPDRVLTVQTADCVPVLLAGPTAIGIAHAGRAGVTLGVVPSVVSALGRLDSPPDTVRVVLGPAIGGCCYEVPEAMHREVVADQPAADATTSWGTPALDLPAAVTAQLVAAGVTTVDRVGGCTRCDPELRWFSHRADAGAGRQLALVVRDPVAAA
jgi:YfiH family protein